jgi:alpha-beta hydrolase superfamily lysophospholipase
MKTTHTYHSLFDHTTLHYSIFDHPSPKACVLMIHGLAEHRARYDALANLISSLGYVVITLDQRGHGETGDQTHLGYFSDEDGWMRNIQDIRAIQHHVEQKYSLNQTILFGHSMGSVVARSLLKHYGDDYIACVLSGLPTLPPGLGALKVLMSLFEKMFGSKTPSKLFYKLSFEAYDKKHHSTFKNAWLSVNEENVKGYNDDPWCGFTLTHRGVLDFLDGMQDVSHHKAKDNLFGHKPMWCVVGLKDPSASHPKDLENTIKLLNKQGYTNITSTIDPFSQHEVFFDVNATTLNHELLTFIQNVTLKTKE